MFYTLISRLICFLYNKVYTVQQFNRITKREIISASTGPYQTLSEKEQCIISKNCITNTFTYPDNIKVVRVENEEHNLCHSYSSFLPERTFFKHNCKNNKHHSIKKSCY